MTIKKYEIDLNIQKAKPRIGKPYSQQPGRKAGRGAGHIVPGAAKEIAEHNSEERKARSKNQQELRGYAQGTLVVPSEAHAMIYLNEIIGQISDGKYENQVGNYDWYDNLQIKVDPSVDKPKLVYTKAGKRPSKHLTFDDCIEYMDYDKYGIGENEISGIVRGLQSAINSKNKPEGAEPKRWVEGQKRGEWVGEKDRDYKTGKEAPSKPKEGKKETESKPSEEKERQDYIKKLDPENKPIPLGGKVKDAMVSSPKISSLKRIVDTKSMGKVDGWNVDLYSASAIIQVYDALSPENKKKYEALPIDKMVNIAFKLLGDK